MQLFNIRKDPRETRDLADDPAYEEKKEALIKLLIENMYGDDMKWVRDDKLEGVPDIEYTVGPNRGLAGQRGIRFL